MAGVSIPQFYSIPRQAALLVLGGAVIGSSFVLPTGGGSGGSAGVGDTPSGSPFIYPGGLTGSETAITLSVLEGPLGTPLDVSGRGFGSNETVRIRFHTEDLAKVETGGDGSFPAVTVRVPSDWEFKGQFDIVATGLQSLRSAREPFRVR